jgi:hypothetical protein
MDGGEVVDKPNDKADSEAVERLVDSQVDQCSNRIDHVATKEVMWSQ